MEFLETEEHASLRDAVRQIARDFGHPYYLRKAQAGEKATELWGALGESGFLGVNVAQEFGGGGAGITELQIVAEEVAAQGCPVLMMVVSPAICATIIGAFGTSSQRARWLPRFATGDLVMAFAITEPDAGTNSHRISTTARRDRGDWVIRGTKYYISGVDEAEAILVVARTGTDGANHAELSLFVVPSDAPGVERTSIRVEIVAPEKQFSLFFDDVRVPADHLVGTEGDGLRQVFQGLNPERVMGAALGNGMARYALDKARAYACDRVVWDVPIGAHQGLAHPLAHAKIQVELARLMTQKAAWLHDRGAPNAGEAANMAKFAAADAGLLALDQAIQIHGGNGFATEYGLATLWGSMRLLRTAPVSREMILNYVAQHSLMLPKSY